jgi:hypothetical protein
MAEGALMSANGVTDAAENPFTAVVDASVLVRFAGCFTFEIPVVEVSCM